MPAKFPLQNNTFKAVAQMLNIDISANTLIKDLSSKYDVNKDCKISSLILRKHSFNFRVHFHLNLMQKQGGADDFVIENFVSNLNFLHLYTRIDQGSVSYITILVYPAGNYLFKVNNRNTRTRFEICSKSTIKTPEQRQWLVLVSLLLTLNIFCTFFQCFYY